MLKNYFKMAYRNLLRNKLSSLINIFGLSIALSCSIVAFLFVDFYYNRDTFHKNAEQIFLNENIVETNGHKQIWGNSPVPLGPALKSDFSQVMRAVRIADGKGIIRYEYNIFDEYFRFEDAEFLDMFTFPLKYGKKNALGDRNTLIFSEEAALKYFGDENPIGEKVTITFNDKYKESFFVKGVTEKLPENAGFGFNILIPYNKQLDLGIKDFNDWSKLTSATFIQLHNP
jgi:putative ABC transport system permease protein